MKSLCLKHVHNIQLNNKKKLPETKFVNLKGISVIPIGNIIFQFHNRLVNFSLYSTFNFKCIIRCRSTGRKYQMSKKIPNKINKIWKYLSSTSPHVFWRVQYVHYIYANRYAFTYTWTWNIILNKIYIIGICMCMCMCIIHICIHICIYICICIYLFTYQCLCLCCTFYLLGQESFKKP